jgi:hypothetical protein
LLKLKRSFTEFSYLTAGDNRVAMLAASADKPQSVVEFDLGYLSIQVVSKASAIDSSSCRRISAKPEVIEFPTDGGLTAFAFYYPPTNPDFACRWPAEAATTDC